jgi:hypothetical protein
VSSVFLRSKTTWNTKKFEILYIEKHLDVFALQKGSAWFTKKFEIPL